MKKEILVNTTEYETRVAILEDDKLVEFQVEKIGTDRMVGDIYKGKVSRVLPGMQAVFVDIGLEQNAFLHFSDVTSRYQDFFQNGDTEKKPRNAKRRFDFSVEKDLRKGNDILVQIVKEPISTKGCRITSEVTLPGRFVVLIPNQKNIDEHKF